MSDHITNLQKQGYSVIQLSQSVKGTAYQKLDSKIMKLYDQGFRKIAVVTNSENPYITNVSEIAARATRNLHGATVIVQPVFNAPQQPAVPATQTVEAQNPTV